MKIVRAEENHFTKQFNCGATSDRKVLPGPDSVRVKVTLVTAPAIAEWIDISYPVDETVYVLEGEVILTMPDGTKIKLGAGDLYVVSAGEIYTLNGKAESSRLLCIFSAIPGGVAVDSE